MHRSASAVPYSRSLSTQLMKNIIRIGHINRAMDERNTRIYVWSDFLQVLLVSEYKTEKSAAVMDVHVGHQSDSEELPGLAHFLEHLLCLGTTNSRSNASTSQMYAIVCLNVLRDHLHEAVDRIQSDGDDDGVIRVASTAPYALHVTHAYSYRELGLKDTATNS